MRRLRSLCSATLAHASVNARGWLAVLSLLGLAAGFALLHPGLGLIVPSSIVLGLLVWSHLSGRAALPPPERPAQLRE